MLLSSAMSGPLSCESLQTTTRRQSARFFASPPSSPQNPLSQSTFPGNLISSCNSLHYIMSSAAAQDVNPYFPPSHELPSPEMTELPTPPLAHAPPPLTRSNGGGSTLPYAGAADDAATTNTGAAHTPSGGKRLLVRARATRSGGQSDRLRPRKKIVKRASTPVPSPNKRRRAAEGDVDQPALDADSDLDVSDSDADFASSGDSRHHPEPTTEQALPTQERDQDPEYSLLPPRPSTPKRSRIAPESLPLGLDRADFHAHFQHDPEQQRDAQRGRGTDPVREPGDDEAWSVEDDKILVELVLAKMRLKPEDWRDCASAMGRDRHALDRRWKSLVAGNHVGVSRRRARLHATWR